MKHSKSGLFLMELIICILFFSLASTVCIRLFAKAHLLSAQTVNENQAIIETQNLAELWLSYEGDLSKIHSTYGQSSINDDVLLGFDKDWNFCNIETARYLITLIPSANTQANLIEADITSYSVDAADRPIYTLHLVHHIAERSEQNGN